MFSFYLLVTTGYLVDTIGCLVITSGYLIATTCYFWLLLVTSRYFSLLLVPRFSNNRKNFNKSKLEETLKQSFSFFLRGRRFLAQLNSCNVIDKSSQDGMGNVLFNDGKIKNLTILNF